MTFLPTRSAVRVASSEIGKGVSENADPMPLRTLRLRKLHLRMRFELQVRRKLRLQCVDPDRLACARGPAPSQPAPDLGHPIP